MNRVDRRHAAQAASLTGQALTWPRRLMTGSRRAGVGFLATSSVLVVVVLTPAAGAAPPAAASAAASARGFGKVSPAGPAIRRTVTPTRGFRISVPNVGRLSGRAGSVSGRGTLVVRPYRAKLRGGLRAAGLGLDVRLIGARLKRRLILVQRVSQPPRHAIPFVAHRGKDGTWDLKAGRLVRGRHIRIVTRRFSLNFPAWLNPAAWVRWIGERFAASVGGRTAPWTCPVHPPDWFEVGNRSSTVHACATSNPDASGVERGEVRIKSNRGAVQQVTLAGDRDYVWVEAQPDAVRKLLGWATRTDPASVVFLPPGNDGRMTVGYRRPSRTSSYSLLVETTFKGLVVNVAYVIIDGVASRASSEVKYGATAYLMAKCSGVLNLSSGAARSPADAVSGAAFYDVLSCVIQQATANFADPRKALAAALELNDPSISRMTTQQYADQLTSTGVALKRLALFLKLRSLLQIGWQGLADKVAGLITGGESTHVDVSLQAAPTSFTAPGSNPPSNPPGGGNSPNQPLPPTTREVVIYNKVTNNATTMREDVPAYLSTIPATRCKSRGCALPGTDMNSGFRIVALCQTPGERTTNGWDDNPIDDSNPGLFSSNRWYLMRWGDGRTGFLSEVWVEPQFRGGMGLPGC